MYPEPSVEGYELRFKSAFRTALDVVPSHSSSIELESVLPDDPPEAINWFSFERIETAILHFFYTIDSFKPPVQTHYPSVRREDPDPLNPLPAKIWRRLPTLLVAPGNHDHLDNLRAFQLAFFTENRVGGWRLGARSRHRDERVKPAVDDASKDDVEPTFTWHSFSVRQGAREWVFLVVDSMYYEGDSSDIGPAQFNDLTDFVNRLSSYGSPLHLVMMMHAPFWTLHGRPGVFLQKLFRHLEELPHVALRLLLAGDMHYYARYNPVIDSSAIRHRAVETPLLVTCGLGGAFKHSTAQLQPHIVTTIGSSYAFQLVGDRSYPPAGYQWALFGLLWPSWNVMFFSLLLYVLFLLSPFFLTDLLFYRLDALLHRSTSLQPALLLSNQLVVLAYCAYVVVVAFLHLKQEYIAAVELAGFALAIAVPLIRIANTELQNYESPASAAFVCRLLFAFGVLFFLFPIILMPLFVASLCGVFTLPGGCFRQQPSLLLSSTISSSSSSTSSLSSSSSSSSPSPSSSFLPSLASSSSGRFRCRRTRSPASTNRITSETLRSLCLSILCIVVIGLAISAYEPFQTHAFSEVSAAYSRKKTHNGFVRMQISDEGKTLKVFFVSIDPLIDVGSVGSSITEPLGEGFSLRHFPLDDKWLRENIRLHDYFLLTEIHPDDRAQKQDS